MYFQGILKVVHWNVELRIIKLKRSYFQHTHRCSFFLIFIFLLFLKITSPTLHISFCFSCLCTLSIQFLNTVLSSDSLVVTSTWPLTSHELSLDFGGWGYACVWPITPLIFSLPEWWNGMSGKDVWDLMTELEREDDDLPYLESSLVKEHLWQHFSGGDCQSIHSPIAWPTKLRYSS